MAAAHQMSMRNRRGSAIKGGAPQDRIPTVRYSIEDLDRKRTMAAKISKVTGERRDKNDMWLALLAETKRFDVARHNGAKAVKALGVPEAPLISDHAVLRFLERCMDIDVESIRAQIARMLPPAAMDHDRVLYTRGHFQFIVRHGVLVTVLAEDMEETVEGYFCIDDSGFGEFKKPEQPNAALSRAARVLSKRATEKRQAPIKAMNARLAAALGRDLPAVLR